MSDHMRYMLYQGINPNGTKWLNSFDHLTPAELEKSVAGTKMHGSTAFWRSANPSPNSAWDRKNVDRETLHIGAVDPLHRFVSNLNEASTFPGVCRR